MNKDEDKKKPFLYIQQPYIEVNEANNQEIFIIRSKRVIQPFNPVESTVGLEAVKEVEEKKVPPKKTIREAIQMEMVPTLSQLQSQPQPQPQSKPEEFRQVKPSFSRRKPFKELTINEKISYLENYPNQLPPVKCFYQLELGVVQGKLNGVNEHQIQILMDDQSLMNIEIQKIIDIFLPGLG